MDLSNKTKHALQLDDHNMPVKRIRNNLELEKSDVNKSKLRSDSKIENILTPEMILVILRILSGKDLCNVVLVSKYFLMIGTDPSLWSCRTINRAKLLSSSPEDIRKFFDITRYKISRLNLAGIVDICILKLIFIFQNILKSNINDINLSDINLAGIDGNLLGMVLSRSTKVNLSGCKGLTPSMLLTLFTHISKSTTLQHMELEKVDLVSLPINLLTKTIQRLKMVSLNCCQFCHMHSGSIVGGCVSSSSFDETNMTLILNAVLNSSSLEDVKLISAVLTPMQSNLIKENEFLSQKIRRSECSCFRDRKQLRKQLRIRISSLKEKFV